MQFVLSMGSSYNAIWFLRDKFYKCLIIALPSAAVFNQFRSLSLPRKLGTQKAKSYLFLALLRGFLSRQGLTAAPHLMRKVSQARTSQQKFPGTLEIHL